MKKWNLQEVNESFGAIFNAMLCRLRVFQPFVRKWVRSVGLFCWLSAGIFSAQSSVAFATSTTPLLIDDAVSIALADNPGLAALQYRVRALSAIPAQQGSLPDLRLSLNMMNIPLDSFDLSQEPMTQLQLGFSQMLPFPGKLALREETAQHEASVAQWQLEEMRLLIVREVKSLWWAVYFADRAVEIVARNIELLRQFVAIAQTKYKVGKGLQQDVLLAQLELSKLHDRAISLHSMRHNQAVRLLALMDRATDQTVLLPWRVGEILADINDESGLLISAAENRPLLAAYQGTINADQARLALARKEYSPDFMLAAHYGYRSGVNNDGSDRADFLTVMLSMNLPIYSASRQDNAVDQRNSVVLQSRFQLDDARRNVAMEVSQALADYQRYREQSILFKQGIIPQASQTVASMLAAYQVNKVDFLNLIRAQITLFDYETAYWKVLSQAKQALARLTAATGLEFIADE